MAWAPNGSATPQYGGATAVNAMSNAQALTYLTSDVTLGANPQNGADGSRSPARS